MTAFALSPAAPSKLPSAACCQFHFSFQDGGWQSGINYGPARIFPQVSLGDERRSCCPDSWPDRPLGKEPAEGVQALSATLLTAHPLFSGLGREWLSHLCLSLHCLRLAPTLATISSQHPVAKMKEQRKIKSTFPKGQEKTEKAKSIGWAQSVPRLGSKLGAGFVCLTIFRIVLCVGLQLPGSPRLYDHRQRFKTGHFNAPKVSPSQAFIIQYM